MGDTCELPLETVVVDVEGEGRSIWTIGGVRSSILDLTCLGFRALCASRGVGSSSAAGGGVWERIYE